MRRQAKLYNLDKINELVGFHKYGLVDFDKKLIRRLTKQITIFQRYIGFMFRDSKVMRVNM